MAIYIDVSAAVHQHAGLARYAASLARALIVHHGQEREFALFYNGKAQDRPLPELLQVPRHTVRAGYKPWRMAVWLGQRLGVSLHRFIPNAELFHATEHLLLPLWGIPTVLTVHDLIYHLFPMYHRRLNYWYLNAAMPLYVRRADAIIAVSHSTKRDLMRVYGVPEEKITVVYEAASPRFRPLPAERVREARTRYRLPERYLLAVGTIEPRKNLERLVDALQLLRQKYPDLCLVIVGSAGWFYQGFFENLERLEDPRSVLQAGYVPDNDLPALISGSSAYVLASFYEGFGLPILEAMACGAPVVCSNTSSLPEIGADAAVYFNPYEIQSMVAAIDQVLRDGELRAQMRQKGFEQAARFSWQRAACETLAVYEHLLTRPAG
ncbi:MAG: glycosyltransferase family 4 protein [Chloroflexi bacterium]|nr:glycosyltransferase family 4 protein [Chloroflexota bacterium]